MWGEPELNPSSISDFIPSRAVRAELKLDFYSFCSVYTRSTAPSEPSWFGYGFTVTVTCSQGAFS